MDEDYSVVYVVGMSCTYVPALVFSSLAPVYAISSPNQSNPFLFPSNPYMFFPFSLTLTAIAVADPSNVSEGVNTLTRRKREGVS